MTSPQRSATMRAVKSRDTTPELAVRKLLREIAPGYRLHRADLPGKPDIVYGRRKLAIFVHGCFWHGHDCARGARAPRTNAAYWSAKIARNRARDENNLRALAAEAWRTIVIFECELRDRIAASKQLESELRDRIAEGDRLHAELDAILRSRSWRVTKPMRVLRGRIASVRGAVRAAD